ncbi:MAG: erythromycin esterase family protein [Gammaproteobacteria bacterium]|nr:erythromycin esterase family protein [Gammaproteobacteria bacterium]
MSAHVHTPFHATRSLARKLTGGARDYDALLAMAEDKQFVLLGEATHGTREFYRMRAEITRRLIDELGFDAVAVEGDWPDAWRVNRYVHGHGDDDAEVALADFERFPLWMWRNREVLDFIGWLRTGNTGRPLERRAGFYGLDLYSLYRSADAVIHYLDRVDPEEGQRARRRYALLDHVRDPQTYGYQSAFGLRPAAHREVVEQLQQLLQSNNQYVRANGLADIDAQFFAERNAAVVVNAETYYRAMFGSRINTWNLRDAHMCDTLFALSEYRRRRGGLGRVVVWAHNSHVGDARATEARERGEWNLGQLVRERAASSALLVGFTTYTGYVSAASEWDGDVEHRWVRPALKDSCEHLFHTTRLERFFLPLGSSDADSLQQSMLQRAIGVIYVPHTERASHYFDVSLASQFDAVFHVDETSALEPLDIPEHWHRRETAAEIV